MEKSQKYIPIVRMPPSAAPLRIEGDAVCVDIFSDGRVILHSGRLQSATPGIGEVIKVGPNKGWIYCETRDRAGFLVSPDIVETAKWVTAQTLSIAGSGDLPDMDELDAIYRAYQDGIIKPGFNSQADPSKRCYWSRKELNQGDAWAQDMKTGEIVIRNKASMFRSRFVRRCSIS